MSCSENVPDLLQYAFRLALQSRVPMVLDRIVRAAQHAQENREPLLGKPATQLDWQHSQRPPAQVQAPPNSLSITHRPGRSLAISVQRLPKRRCAKQMRRSSSGDHGSFRMVGSSWFLMSSRHCLPLRPLSCAATMAHLRSPCSFTSATIRSSSSCDHGRLRGV